MPFDWTQIAGALLVLAAVMFFYRQIRYRPRATKEIKTGADLRARISSNHYTLVQVFAPL